MYILTVEMSKGSITVSEGQDQAEAAATTAARQMIDFIL